MNDTLNFLCEATLRIRREEWACDPQYQLYEEEHRVLMEQFKASHRHNRPLMRDVIRLLDSATIREEWIGQSLFLLGLQMGLELRDVHFLPKMP